MKTPVSIDESINLPSPVSFYGLGSCFIENFANTPLPNTTIQTNPLGTTFNPLSIANTLAWICKDQPLSPLIQHADTYHQLDGANTFQNINKEALNARLTHLQKEAQHQLKNADCLIISLGTAHAWRHLSTNAIVNNCHKIPGTEFKRELLDIETIKKSLHTIIQLVNLPIIWTISPVKYTKIGLTQNFLGKSTLRLALEEILTHPNQYYFPSFEIITDELRDYKYFKENGTHPNQDAVEIVLNRFSTFIS